MRWPTAGRVARWLLAVVAIAMLPAGEARGENDAPLLQTMWEQIQADLARASQVRTRKPPKPVAITWKKRRLGALDLGKPLLALAVRDVDGNGKADLIALTTRELAIVYRRGRRLIIGPRIALPDVPAPVRSRDPVGVLALSGPGLITARTSDQAEGMAIEWTRGQLIERGKVAQFPVCSAGSADLHPGRNLFAATTVTWSQPAPHRAVADDFVAVGCPAELVDPGGYALDVFAVVDADDRLTVRCQSERGACEPGAIDRIYEKSGYAFDVADVDNDGHPEVITSAAVRRGITDKVVVHARGPDGVRSVFETKMAGGVIALATGDVDGDGVREVVAAVRLSGTTKVELWTLN